ncbi:hypothetical protein BCR34DRAFT_593162 [Clohesyomyces aquaticus]|uniref:Leucine-rich repeat domain-containing protein n=1 Tax=Clohesyomyces aquaticus TaxID=1231657 RepID=A0A1Y1YKH0_9PLEO|nr:hypothetical protein BCR34DRAFT_593162 [Clohesyomyces aquaticus]
MPFWYGQCNRGTHPILTQRHVSLAAHEREHGSDGRAGSRTPAINGAIQAVGEAISIPNGRCRAQQRCRWTTAGWARSGFWADDHEGVSLGRCEALLRSSTTSGHVRRPPIRLSTTPSPLMMSNDTAAPVSDHEVVALARAAIEQSREDINQRAVADTPGAPRELQQQQPGITIDLGHNNIARLPDEVIDVIRAEIERLALSHNQLSSLPTRLIECKRLRYLNVRYNAMREIPQAVRPTRPPLPWHNWGS